MLFSSILVLFISACALSLIVYRLFIAGKENLNEKAMSLVLTGYFFSCSVARVLIDPLVIAINNIFLSGKTTAPDNIHIDTKHAKGAKDLMSVFPTFPLKELFIVIIAYVLIYHLILRLKKYRNSTDTTKEVKQNVTYNLVILSVLGFSIYLVVSVFVAIPYLNEARKPGIFTVKDLDTAMTQVQYNDSSWQIKIDQNVPVDSIHKLVFDDINVKTEYEESDKATQKSIDTKIKSIQEREEQINAKKNDAARALNEFNKQSVMRINTLKRSIINNFTVECQSISTDKNKNYSSYLTAFQAYYQAQVQYFRTNNSAIKAVDARNETIRQKIVTSIKTGILSDGINSTSADSFISYPEIIDDGTLPVLTVNKKDGSEWGALGKMSRYLIRTSSLDLVLLIGMFGFGLLGASILSFEKNDDFISNFKKSPLIKNFLNVLIRGFGAALIVYLATKGGLAVFSGNANADPNGYMLLLTCFVGAVYSQKVWDRIYTTLYPDPAEGTDPPATAPAPNKPPKPEGETPAETI